MKERLKLLLEKLHILPVIHFFRYGFRKNVKNLRSKAKSKSYKKKTLKKLFPREYAKYAKLPIEEDKVVFIETRLPEVTNSFRVLYNELVGKYNFRVHTHFMLDQTASKEEYFNRCIDMLRDVATAKYVFLNEANNVISCVDMRPETIVTQMWHGCGAFKKWGMSTADLIFGLSAEELRKYPNYKNLTYVTVSSPEVSWAYAEAMDLLDKPETVVPVGISRTDIFYDEDYKKKAFDKLYALMPQARGKKVILYAPTFRGRVAKAKTPELLDVDMFKEAFEGEYVLLFKHHPFVKKPMEIQKADAGFAQDFTDAMTIEELLFVADICISDYSSLIFEYALFEKPMIFFSFDLSEYFDWRGFFYDYDELAPGPIFTTNREMIDYIEHVDERFDRKRVQDFRAKFMSACDGHATERLMDKVFGKENLDKYRREAPLTGSFDRIPNADYLYRQVEDRLDDLAWMKSEGQKIYDNACANAVTAGRVGIFASDYADDAARYFMARAAKTEKYTFFKLDDIYSEKEEKNPKPRRSKLEKIIGDIASCSYIFLTRDHDIVNALELRQDTKAIMAWNEILPVEKFGAASKETRSGLNRDYTDIAPLHNNYSLIPMASENLKDIYKEAFGISDDAAYRATGAILTDILFDKKKKKESREKLEEVFPAAKGKKVIFYKPKYRLGVKRPGGEVFIDYRLMNEYLKDDYVVVYISPLSKVAKKDHLFQYFGSFIYDAGETMTATECMLACDAMIGDYDADVYTFAVTDKPVFLYAPDYRWYLSDRDTYYAYEEMAPGPVIENTADLIKAIENLDTYDFTAQKNFKEKFMSACDGHSTKRLLELMDR